MTDLKVIDGDREAAETVSQEAAETLNKKRRSQSDRERLSRAFIELEPDICGLVRAGELTSLAEDQGDDGLLTFALGQFQKMAEDLKRKYYELYKG
jgi:hypothetical protein